MAFTIAWFTLKLPNKKATQPIDILGVILLSAFTTCLIFFTDFGGDSDHGWQAMETWAFGIGMLAAIGFVPTFLQMSSGTSAAASGLLMLPMMVGLIGASIVSGIAITRMGRHKLFPILGTLVTGASMIGTATSTNNDFREVGASLGVAVFGTIFTTRLTENLTEVFTKAGASPSDAAGSTATLDPQTLATLPDAIHDGVVTAYADALTPVFWYLLPFIGIAFVLSLFLKQIPLSDAAGLVARGEAIGGAEAEELESAQRAGSVAVIAEDKTPADTPH